MKGTKRGLSGMLAVLLLSGLAVVFSLAMVGCRERSENTVCYCG